MVGVRLILIMAIVGGFIAFLADRMGGKIGKRKMTIFGLRPKYTSILLTVISGTLIAVLTVAVMAIASDSARTALFGMEKLERELAQLNEEKQQAASALTEAKKKVEDQNKEIDLLDAKIEESTKENDAMEANLAQVNEKYRSAQSEVASLTEARDKLTGEIADLEKTTESLRKGIMNIREGQVFYRAGEVVFVGIMRGGLGHEENITQLNWLLQNANENALQRLGVDTEKQDKPMQAVWISKETLDEALKALDTAKGNLFLRIRTVANIIVGEPVVCEIEVHENQFIFPDGTLILSEDYDLRGTQSNTEGVILSFLSKINHRAVEAGVLPDPLTGKVGNMEATTMIEASKAMRATDGVFTLRAYARGDITTAGPVRVRLEVVPRNAE